VDFVALVLSLFHIIFFHLYRLGIRREDLPKHEEQLELKISKAQLEELKKDALEAMETQKKRYVVDACLPSYSNHFPFRDINFWEAILN
jgi:hypothetical protein